MLVVGNCQAEATRQLVTSTGTAVSFRIPPVHEWTREDAERVHALLPETDALVMQPVRDNYRGLACGTAQLADLLPAHGRVVTFPVLRYDGLMPYQAIVRSPSDPSLNPPLVPYHDLRILATAATGGTSADVPDPAPGADALRRLAAMSVAQLRRREEAHGTVRVSGHLATAPVWHTINHPDNATLGVLAEAIARALHDALGTPAPGAVQLPADREMLGAVQAPVDPAAAAALGVRVQGRDGWRPGAEELTEAHLEFYRRHPDVVAAGLTRHAERLALLGLTAQGAPHDPASHRPEEQSACD
ncbi:hypothetical protein CGUA_05705 [Corynebacterium guangdongense]|nr:hypothetical protein CGUA_05705 [Corynebacterium guangdongense]